MDERNDGGGPLRQLNAVPDGASSLALHNEAISTSTHNSAGMSAQPETPVRGRGRNFRRFGPSSDGRGKGFHRKNKDHRLIPSDGSGQSEQKTAPKGNKPGRKRFQRRKRPDNKPKWKPYHLLSWEEKKVLEERETKRAEQRRNQLTTLGFPQAPYNTTQFLMEDHKSEHDKDYEAFMSSEESSPGPEGEDGEDSMKLDRGYDQECVRVLAASLEGWSKDRLIAHVLQLEQERNDLERRVKTLEKEVDDLVPKGESGNDDVGENKDRLGVDMERVESDESMDMPYKQHPDSAESV